MKKDLAKSGPLLLGVFTYVAWGSLPLFWKLLKSIPPEVVLANRIVWGTFFLFLYLFLSNAISPNSSKPKLLPSPKEAIRHLPSAIALTINWGIYIWAVGNNLVLASSLGYFLAPILYLLAGVLIFKEKLRIYKKLAGILGGLALLPLVLKVDLATIIVALALGLSIVAYGIFRKSRALEPIRGVYIESLIVTPLAMAYLYFANGEVFFSYNTDLNLLLALAGLVTAVPLITYGRSILSITLSEMALLQYISPILQFLLGFLYFGEAMDIYRWGSFLLIWLAVGVMILDIVGESKSRKSVEKAKTS